MAGFPATLHDSSSCQSSGQPVVPRRLHVVVVDEELPYPLTSGKRLRTFHLLTRLAHRHDITYIAHGNPDPRERELARRALEERKIEVISVDRKVPAKSGIGFYARLAANLASPLPYSVTSHRSNEIVQAVLNHAHRHTVDIWHAEWTPYFEALRYLSGARRVVCAHNVESMIWQRYVQTEANLVKRWYIKKQCRKFRRYEAQVFAQADCAIAVTDLDAHTIVNQLSGRCVAVVENGVDVEFFQPSGQVRHPNQILFVGSLDWRPNLDAVRLLLDLIFPEVLRQEPQARLVVVGRHPPSWLQRKVDKTANAILCANVLDVRPYLNTCGTMAVPLRIGGGSRLKILEALAAGLPVVSTRVGAEGLNLMANHDLQIVDTPQEMAAALVAALRDPQSAQHRAFHGRQHVIKNYDWSAIAPRLEQAWLRCAQGNVGALPTPAQLEQLRS
jgi:glycosyltransferase involved in cell wall biosynthesis